MEALDIITNAVTGLGPILLQVMALALGLGVALFALKKGWMFFSAMIENQVYSRRMDRGDYDD